LVLYILLAGLVGLVVYSCCKYNENPAESEIIINVPLALKIMTTGYIWPISAWQELISGDLVARKTK
jgi:photosystem I subunit 3